jgi:hypothetical protein
MHKDDDGQVMFVPSDFSVETAETSLSHQPSYFVWLLCHFDKHSWVFRGNHEEGPGCS